MKRLAILLSLHFLCFAAGAEASWTLLRLSACDTYADEESYERDASNVYGMRFGLLNSVNRDVYGISLTLGSDGGLAFGNGKRNYIDDNFGGFKMGGLVTSFAGTGVGIQFAAIENSGGDMTGLQLAGVRNCATFMQGIQLGGLGCQAEVAMHGFQIAGLYALVGTGGGGAEAGGLQFGGLGTCCKGTFSGVQIGCINHARELHGLQIGVINNTDCLQGIQIGVLNVSGTLEKGDLFCLPVANARF